MMSNLPKRDDAIYKEIESFKPYELTQCVTYEMAVRSDENLKAIEEIVQNHNNDKENISNEYQIIQEKINGIDCIGLMYDDKRLSDINEIIKKKNDFIEKIKINYEITSNSIDNSNYEEREGYFIHTNLSSFLSPNSQSHMSNGLHIFDNFKRPKLRTDILRSKSATVALDLNKPLKELIAYITHIKEDLEINKDILKSPLELLGETSNDAIPQKDYPKEPTAKKMADMFFIYDYVKARQNNMQEMNKISEIELEEEIENIKKFHTGKDRKTRITYARAEYLERVENKKVPDILKEEELTEVVKNISKLYYAIKPYIEDLKYKELITGVSTI